MEKNKKLINKLNMSHISDLFTVLKCNNNCLTCALNDKQHIRPFSEIKEDLVKARRYAPDIALTGGEPTIDKNFFKILNYIKSLKFDNIMLTTNGRIFSNKAFLSKVLEKNVITHFIVSLHSDQQKEHELVTQVPGSFNQTIRGIKNLKEAGQFVMVELVISKANHNKLLEMARLLSSLKINQVHMVYIRPIGFTKKNFNLVVPSLNEIESGIKKAIDFYNSEGIYCLVEGIPFCFLKGYENYIGEKNVPERIILGGTFFSELSEIIDKDNRVKSTRCSSCIYSDACRGVWKEAEDNLKFISPITR